MTREERVAQLNYQFETLAKIANNCDTDSDDSIAVFVNVTNAMRKLHFSLNMAEKY